MRVRAIETGYIGGKRRDPGEEFSIEDRALFSRKWMEAIDPDPLDHDGDGKKGGVRPRRSKAKDEPEAVDADI